jgi:hypothetical protein
MGPGDGGGGRCLKEGQLGPVAGDRCWGVGGRGRWL